MSSEEWNNYNWPLISFSFDDGGSSTHSVGMPLFASFGVVACAGIISTFPGTGSNMTWDQIRELQNAGWEICCHSYDHNLAGWDSTSEEFMTLQLITSWQELTAQGLIVSNYICPGATNFAAPASVLSSAKGIYHTARKITQGVNEMPISLPWQLTVQYLDTTDIVACKAVIDAELSYVAKGARHWVQFYGHQFNPDDVVFLTELLTYIQSKNLGIYTIQQALDIGGVVRFE